MTPLNNAQIAKIIQVLKLREIKKRKLLEELTDHVACAVEKAMQEGKDFESALEETMASFAEGELPAIQHENKKSFRNKHQRRGILTGAIAAACMFFAIIVRADDRPDIPPYQQNLRIVDGYFSANIDGFIYEISGKLDIYATADGLVSKIIEIRSPGNDVSVIIDHPNGFQTIYTNLKNVKLKEGDKVKKSGKIGEVKPINPSRKSYFIYKIMNAGSPVPSNKYY